MISEVLGAAVLSAGVALVTSRLTAMAAHRTKKAELEASPYEALADRVVILEGRVSRLEGDLRADRSWITRTIARILEYDEGLMFLLRPFPRWHEADPEEASPPSAD